jgi:glycosyltransferase involved in cell wall biosynthesis
MRVLHLPTTVGDPSGLSRLLRDLGIDSEVWALGQNYLGYHVDRLLSDEGDGNLVRFLKMLRAGGYVFGRWDVVHYNFGSTLFSTLHSPPGRTPIARLLTPVLNGVAALLTRAELGVLRARRIPVFVHYQGDDARQGDYSLEHYEISIAAQVPPGYYSPASDRWKRRQIRLISRHAARLYAVNPDLMNVLPDTAVFVPYGHIPVRDWTPRYTQADRKRLVFAHAPTNRAAKGTDLILAALAELADEGYEFDLDLVENVGNDDALERYAQADVLIDQLYAGWYGGLALEAMALGKPVVAYLRESDLRHLDPQMQADLPVVRATPGTITDDLRRVLERPRGELVELGRRSRAYAERWHDGQRIAQAIAAHKSREVGAVDGTGGTQLDKLRSSGEASSAWHSPAS